MGSAVRLSQLYQFQIAGRRLKLYKRVGESYEHVLLKALGYAMFVSEYPRLEIECDMGWRYTPDLSALDEHGQPLFWGECGHTGLRKIVWLTRHSGAEKIVLFKLGISADPFVAQLQREIPARYRPDARLLLINFHPAVVDEIGERIGRVRPGWYRQYYI